MSDTIEYFTFDLEHMDDFIRLVRNETKNTTKGGLSHRVFVTDDGKIVVRPVVNPPTNYGAIFNFPTQVSAKSMKGGDDPGGFRHGRPNKRVRLQEGR